jgi:arginyl-tRNA synthetase
VIRYKIAEDLRNVLQSLGMGADLDVSVEPPANPSFGDFATNVALQLAKEQKSPPRKVAERIAEAFHSPWVSKVDIAGPGFINFRVKPYAIFQALLGAAGDEAAFWRPDVGHGRKVLIEFVSANPTHPLHVGHGRGAVYGDVLASLMAKTGHDVWREYYVNDIGNQMDKLGKSLHARYRELCGVTEPFPEDGYQGEYVRDVARQLLAEIGPARRDVDYDTIAAECKAYISSRLLQGIRDDIGLFRIEFDRWYSEKEIYERGLSQRVINRLRQDGWLYEQDNKLVFRSSVLGDDEDRVVVRDTGVPTYFASDIAYHFEKFERGFDELIDIWGADHHGYVPRMKASIQALGRDPEKFRVILLQFVRLLRNGEPVAMSGRAGNFVTVREVLDEVGVDATRFFFMLRSGDAPLDFDLELAKQQTNENPVFYVQYGHARISSILAKAAAAGLVPGVPDADELEAQLVLPDEIDLAKKVLEYPHVLRSIARTGEIHPLAFYLIDLTKQFHGYYTRGKGSDRVISDDAARTRARLTLVELVRRVIRDALDTLKITAPDRMASVGGDNEE